MFGTLIEAIVEMYGVTFCFKYSYLLIHVRLDVQFLWDRQTKYLVCQPSFYNLNFRFTQKKSGWDSILAQKNCVPSFFDWGYDGDDSGGCDGGVNKQ